MRRIFTFFRWSLRCAAILLCGLGITTWIAGYETRASDDYVGYSSRWGTLQTEWSGGFWNYPSVWIWWIPPEPPTPWMLANHENHLEYCDGGNSDFSEQPCGFFYTHGENSGESQAWIMALYGCDYIIQIPSGKKYGYPTDPDALPSWNLEHLLQHQAFGRCFTAVGTHWYYLKLRTDVAGALLFLPALLWLTIYLRTKWKRRSRLKRGLCIYCGYDLRFSPKICPECGHQSTPHKHPPLPQ